MKAKIFVAYHKEAELIQNEVLTPIHVGRDFRTSKWLEDNMIGDNTGDNISSRNNRYSELTAQYYAWKNYDKIGSPDYIGFCHYRRLFSFNTREEFPLNTIGEIEYNSRIIDNTFYEKFSLSKENIENVIASSDIIVPAPTNVKKLNNKNVYAHYAHCHNIKDYNIALKILLRKYPEFKEAAKTYNKSDFAYFTNSFIMKKELFMEYAEWMFSILFDAEKYMPEKPWNKHDRLMGYISERLLGIYITYLKQKKYKIKELSSVFIDTAIPVVFACNNNFTQHLCSTMSSIIENSAPDEEFKFYILNTKKNLNYLNKRIISKYNKNKARVIYITLDNRADMFNNMPLTKSCKHISIETYYRFLLADLFPFYEKIIYLDCDTTVLTSLTKLYDTDINGYYCGVVSDVLAKDSMIRLNLDKYFNAGVMLVNLDKWRRDGIQQKLFEYVEKNSDKILWVDQDVLNVVLQDGIKYIDKRWNAQVGEYEHCYSSGFNDIGKEAYILHYIGCSKPWQPGSKNPFREVYFKYLNMTGWECRIAMYNLYLLRYYTKTFFGVIKNIRKSVIWYDKRNKQLVFFNKFFYKIG